MPDCPGSAYHVSLVGSGSEEHTQLSLKYYADEDFRLDWSKSFPDEPLPQHDERGPTPTSRPAAIACAT